MVKKKIKSNSSNSSTSKLYPFSSPKPHAFPPSKWLENLLWGFLLPAHGEHEGVSLGIRCYPASALPRPTSFLFFFIFLSRYFGTFSNTPRCTRMTVFSLSPMHVSPVLFCQHGVASPWTLRDKAPERFRGSEMFGFSFSQVDC